MSEQAIDVAIKYIESQSKVLTKLGSKVRYRLKELEQRVIDAHPAVDAVISIDLAEPHSTAEFGYSRAAKFWVQIAGNNHVYDFDDMPLFIAAACYHSFPVLLDALVENTKQLQKSLEVV